MSFSQQKMKKSMFALFKPNTDKKVIPIKDLRDKLVQIKSFASSYSKLIKSSYSNNQSFYR